MHPQKAIILRVTWPEGMFVKLIYSRGIPIVTQGQLYTQAGKKDFESTINQKQ